MQLELYKRHNPGLSKHTQKGYTYFTSCPCDNYHQKWRNINGVEINYMMNRCKVKPCKNATFGTSTNLWDHFLGKSGAGCTFYFALCRIIEHAYPFEVPGGEKRKLMNQTHPKTKTKKRDHKVSDICMIFEGLFICIDFVSIFYYAG